MNYSLSEMLRDEVERSKKLESELAALKAENAELEDENRALCVQRDGALDLRNVAVRQRDRVREALALCNRNHYTIRFESGKVVLVTTNRKHVAHHCGCDDDIERALIEAVDAARKATP
jgi:hypothetical protein